MGCLLLSAHSLAHSRLFSPCSHSDVIKAAFTVPSSWSELQLKEQFLQLTRIEGALTLNAIDSLTTLDGVFPALTEIQGDLVITSNPNLVAIQGFQELEEMDGGFIRIHLNPILSNLKYDTLEANNYYYYYIVICFASPASSSSVVFVPF